ncbi:hypothetical protein FKM82_015319 [Ascaphus truei]
MGLWSISVGALGAAVAGIILANTDLFLSRTDKATLEYLEETELRTIAEEPRSLKARELWVGNGAVIMAEASELSSLKPQLDQLGVPLYAVVKEKIGTEVEDFQPYFKGEIYLDEKKRFYGPQRRKMMLMGFLRLGVIQNFRRAWKSGYTGNLEGEGVILGGVFVIGSGKQGIILEHREKEFGDKANMTAVLEAARKIDTQTSGGDD